MDVPMTVHREVALDLPVDELWALIATADGWRRWLVDEADLAIAPSAQGSVVDDGVRRVVRVDRVDDGREVVFHWADSDHGDDLSRVTLVIVDDHRGRRLQVTEEWLAPAACADCPLRAGARWDLRACLLCLRAIATCPV